MMKTTTVTSQGHEVCFSFYRSHFISRAILTWLNEKNESESERKSYAGNVVIVNIAG
jgi:hypothetical protein